MFILGTGREVSINEVYQAIAKLLGSKVQPKYGPSKADDIMRMRYNSAKAKTTLAFEPNTTVEDGLAETIEYLKRKTTIR